MLGSGRGGGGSRDWPTAWHCLTAHQAAEGPGKDLHADGIPNMNFYWRAELKKWRPRRLAACLGPASAPAHVPDVPGGRGVPAPIPQGGLGGALSRISSSALRGLAVEVPVVPARPWPWPGAVHPHFGAFRTVGPLKSGQSYAPHGRAKRRPAAVGSH